MGPGPCLEGVLLRCLHTPSQKLAAASSIVVNNSKIPRMGTLAYGDGQERFSMKRKVIHIVGGGIPGVTLAATLDPDIFEVKIFEASSKASEKGYGLAIWPSTMAILRDNLGIFTLDFFPASSMDVHVKESVQNIPFKSANHKYKGFIQRSHLLKCLMAQALDRHPDCLSTDHKCLRIHFESHGQVKAVYETREMSVTHFCDLLVGADGVNSVVRKYVSLESDCRHYGHMAAYRFVIPKPSDALLKQTKDRWNMSLGEDIHSPYYHISREGEALSMVILEYDGKPPNHPYKVSIQELVDVANRSKLVFVLRILKHENIEDLMSYSTYHIDCKPWHNQSAVIIGDAAHAYGPLTAKMANLTINDALSCQNAEQE